MDQFIIVYNEWGDNEPNYVGPFVTREDAENYGEEYLCSHYRIAVLQEK